MEIRQPKISIITVCYNEVKGIESTIESVVNQSYSGIEYIVIDGGSNDGSKEIIELHSTKIHHWESEPDEGIYNAMNKGIQLCSGDYICFLNAGDAFESNNGIQLLVDHVEDDKSIIYPNICDVKGMLLMPKLKHFPDVLLHSSIPHQGALIPKFYFTEFGLYREDLKIVSDWEKYLKIYFSRGEQVFKHNSRVSVLFDVNGISSTQIEKRKVERQNILSEHTLEIIKLLNEQLKWKHNMRRSKFFKIISLLYKKTWYTSLWKDNGA